MLRRRLQFLPLVLLALVSGLVVGCSTASYQLLPIAEEGSLHPEPDNYRIYAFRSDQMTGAARSMEIRVADRLIGELGHDGYLCWDRPVGRAIGQIFYHGPKIDVKVPESVFEVNGESGQTYYCEIRVNVGSKKPEVVILSEAEGLAVINTRKAAEVRRK